MTKVVISDEIRNALRRFLADNPQPELVTTYLTFIETKFNLQPVLFPKTKTIYISADDAAKAAQTDGKLWHETQIKITFGDEAVNEETRRIYICPFTGKVFGDNTHPNPQDAIYDWVSKCPENTERSGGLRVKRFFVSEDPEVISNYISKTKPKEVLIKTVYSSEISGKLFNTKEGVIRDFKENSLKPMTLVEVQSQNRFRIEDKFVAFIQDQLDQDKIADFVESLAECEEFVPYIEQWIAWLRNYTTTSFEETIALGVRLGKELAPNSVLCFFGDLGAGKTTLVKGIVEGATQLPPENVNSPTFVYLNIYKGPITIYHFDLYRLRGVDEFMSMGFDELFDVGGICCIEWSEKIAQALPTNCIKIEMRHLEENKREIVIHGT